MRKKKSSQSNKLILFILFIILGIALYYKFNSAIKEFNIDNKKEEKSSEELKKETKEEKKNIQQEEKKQEVKKESTNAYKTSDGKYQLIIVDKNDKEEFAKAKEAFKKANNNKEISSVGYAYLNDMPISLNSILEDELYATYIGDFPKIEGKYKEYFLVDVKKKTILEKDEFNSEGYTNNYGNDYNRFNGELRGYIHLKNKAGYFFQKASEKEELIYTVEWKKLGYLDSVDNSGVNVCNDYVFCTVITKYDDKGNKLEVNKNNDFFYKTKDNKYNLRIIHQEEIKDNDGKQDKYSLYAYFNDHDLIGIDSYNIDSKYTLYKGTYINRSNDGKEYYLVNNDTRELIKNPFFTKEEMMDNEGFYLFNEKHSPINYLKTSIGYFFIFEDNVRTVYTTKWEKLGYTKEVKIDGKGIVLYDNMELTGTPKKYDNSGKIIN